MTVCATCAGAGRIFNLMPILGRITTTCPACRGSGVPASTSERTETMNTQMTQRNDLPQSGRDAIMRALRNELNRTSGRTLDDEQHLTNALAMLDDLESLDAA